MKSIYRNHPLFVVFNSFKSLYKLAIPLILLILNNGKEDLVFKISILFITTIVILIWNTILWKKTTYQIIDNKFSTQTGIFRVTQMEIPFNTIQTFDVSETFIHKFFKVVKIKMDTGNTSSDEVEMEIMVKADTGELIKTMIFKEIDSENLKANDSVNSDFIDNDENIIISFKELIILSITSVNFSSGFVIFMVIFRFLDDYLIGIFNIDLNYIKTWILANNISEFSVTSLILNFAMMFIMYFIVCIIAIAAKNIIKYSGFSVRRDNDFLSIDYGWIDKKHYKLQVKKISAVYIKQNFWQKLLKFQSLRIETIGYGNESGEIEFLYPMINESKSKVILEKLLPELYFDGKIIKAEKRTCKRFILSNIIKNLSIVFIIGFIIYLFLGDLRIEFIMMIIAIFVLYGILIGTLEYKNTAIGIDSNILYFSNGGFNHSIVLVPNSKIQTYSFEQNIFQKRKKLFNYVVSVQSNALRGSFEVKNINENLKKYFLNLINLD